MDKHNYNYVDVYVQGLMIISSLVSLQIECCSWPHCWKYMVCGGHRLPYTLPTISPLIYGGHKGWGRVGIYKSPWYYS